MKDNSLLTLPLLGISAFLAAAAVQATDAFDEKSSISDVQSLLAYSASSAPVALSNGSGDGSLQITVDGYGSFGSSTPAGDAIYDPLGSLGSAGTVYESGLFFSPVQNFLTTDSFGAALPPTDFSYRSATEARSKFPLADYAFEVTQYITPRGDKGSTLVQRYRITNKTVAQESVTLVRHVDGDLKFIGSYTNDRGYVTPDGKLLGQFDANDSGAIVYPTFLGIMSANSESYTIQPFRFTDDIISSNGIPSWAKGQIYGDSNGDRITDYGYDVTMSQESEFVLARNQTVVYVTKTIFGGGGQILNFPVPVGTGGWYFTAGSPYHKPHGGVFGADDTFAMDLNLPGDKDAGKPVYPITSGTVVQSIPKYGWVLIKHSIPLDLVSGERVADWYSGYLHMSNIIAKNQEVSTSTVLGNVSNVAANGITHLHLVIYRGPAALPPLDNSGLVSIDFAHEIPTISGQIDGWYEWCGAHAIIEPGPWWQEGQLPCTY